MSVIEKGHISHETLALSSILPHPRNYRKHTDRQIGQLQKSLSHFGQVRSVVVQGRGDGTYLTVAGHGVIDAAKKLRWNAIWADILPVSWTEKEIEAYLVADNQHAKHAQDDEYLLAELLQEQKEIGFSFDAIGMTEKELQDLLKNVENSHATDFLQPFFNQPSIQQPTFVEPHFVEPVIQQQTPAPQKSLPPVIQEDAQYFPVTYTLTYGQRDIVLQAIKKAKEIGSYETSQEALVFICQRFLS